MSFKKRCAISSSYEFQAHQQRSQRRWCFSQNALLWFEVLPDAPRFVAGAPRCSAMRREACNSPSGGTRFHQSRQSRPEHPGVSDGNYGCCWCAWAMSADAQLCDSGQWTPRDRRWQFGNASPMSRLLMARIGSSIVSRTLRTFDPATWMTTAIYHHQDGYMDFDLERLWRICVLDMGFGQDFVGFVYLLRVWIWSRGSVSLLGFRSFPIFLSLLWTGYLGLGGFLGLRLISLLSRPL